jgi:hypothetical protein
VTEDASTNVSAETLDDPAQEPEQEREPEQEPVPQLEFVTQNWHIDTLTLDPRVFTRLINATRQRHEMGGMLIGQRDPSTASVNVLGFAFPRQSRQTPVFCSFDMRWASLMKAAIIECDLHPKVTLIAWIHTHPQLSVFLSGTDVQTIDELQQFNPLTLAVVLDPYKNDMGAFHYDRRQRDTRIEYTQVDIDAELGRQLRQLKQSRQVKKMGKSWFLTDAQSTT